MPAVTADPLTLTRLPRLPEQETAWRPVAKIVTAARHIEGEGFQVRRPFPGIDLSLADPFLLLDHMGAVEYAPAEARALSVGGVSPQMVAELRKLPPRGESDPCLL